MAITPHLQIFSDVMSFLTQIHIFADTLVFRIILKDGKIMTPSEVWKIADVYMWGGNYFTEDDIIFLKKLSRYYNKSDLNRLENFSRTILLQ